MQWLLQNMSWAIPTILVCGFLYGMKRHLDILLTSLNRIELSLETMNGRMNFLQNSLSHLEGRIQGHYEAKSIKQIQPVPSIEVKRRRIRKPSSSTLA